MLKRLVSFARAAFGRSGFERAMDDEIRFHVESRTADLIRRGLAPDEAARRARVEFGSIEKHKEESRASVGLRLIDEVRGDTRYALRTFARNKAFTATAIVTLALGIGANAAIFGLINGLALRWLPVPRPHNLVLLVLDEPANKGKASVNVTFSYPLVSALAARNDIFAGVAGFSSPGGLTVGAGASLSRASRAYVTGGFYDTLGLTPVLGRLLTHADDRTGAPLVAVVSYGYWERAFGSDQAIVGRTILLNGTPAEIVGVSPRGFNGANVGATADVTMPVAALPAVNPPDASLLGAGNFWLRALARLRPGTSEETAAARLSAEWPSIVQPAINPKWSEARQKELRDGRVWFTPGATGWTYLREMYAKPLQLLMGIAALVLLIACTNVAGLMLARGGARRSEIAVRFAIGAGRARIVRQLLVESAILALAGSTCGVLLAPIAGGALVKMMSMDGGTLVLDLAPDRHILAFSAAIAMATALLFGLAPAIQATETEPAAVLKHDRRIGGARSRLLPSLVAAQMALSLILLVGAGLFVRTLRNLQAQDPGFSADGVLTVRLDPRAGGMPAAALREVRAIPGVFSASASTDLPLSGSIWSEPAVPAEQPLPERDTAVFFGVSPDFFATLSIPLRAGRAFTTGDTAAAPPVAIIDEQFARRYFSGRSAVGSRLAFRHDQQAAEIVGVAGNTRVYGLRDSPSPVVYLPYAQLPGQVQTTIEVRAAAATNAVETELRRILHPLSPRTPVEVRRLSASVDATLKRERMVAALAMGFGVLALVLAAVGIYGLLSYAVMQRTREIGIRIALGARRGGVVALIVRGALTPLAAGIAIALPAAWLLSRLVESMLFGLRGTDPLTNVGAVVLLVLVAQLAAFLPARRAARVNPVIALRNE